MHSAACFLKPSSCPGRTVRWAKTSSIGISPPLCDCRACISRAAQGATVFARTRMRSRCGDERPARKSRGPVEYSALLTYSRKDREAMNLRQTWTEKGGVARPGRTRLAAVAAALAAVIGIGLAVPHAQQIWGGFYGRTPPRFPTPASFGGGFTFCRIMFDSDRREKQGWGTDYPGADINFSIRLAQLTK